MKIPRWLTVPGRAGLVGLALLASSVPAAPPNVAAERDKVDDVARQFANQTPAGGRLPVLITRRDRARPSVLSTHGNTVRLDLSLGNLLAADIDPSDLNALAADPSVVRVTYDAPMRAQASPDPLTQVGNLRSVYPLAVQADRAWNGTPPTRGSGVGVAVIDSGIDANHHDFWGPTLNAPNSRIVATQGAVLQTPGAVADDYGHGTWVSSIAVGRGWGQGTDDSEGQYVGIAPDANLVAVKAADSTGMTRTSDMVNAIQWVFDHQAAYNIRVLNISSVSSVAESYTTSALDAAVEMACLRGIVVVVSAGNGGPNSALYAPANDPFVITVGATDDKGTASTADDTLATFSSYGTTQDGLLKPDLVAPGRRIVGALAAGNPLLGVQFPNNVVPNQNNLYISLSGTSASAPIVSGAVADLLQARPDLKPDDVKGLLAQTALPVPGVGTGAGYPRLLAATAFTGPITRANVGRVPNNYVASAGCATLPTGTDCSQANWSNVSWNSVSWNSVSWNSVSWNSVSWNSVSWNSVSWNSVTGL